MDQKNGLRSFEHIAKLIRTSRINHAKGYSQSELSHLLGYKNGQFISNVERALCNIPFKMLQKVCEILDISQDDLKQAILKDYEDTLDNHFKTNGSENVSSAKKNAPNSLAMKTAIVY